MNKMKLVPVEVPWRISPEYDFSYFNGYENREVSVEVLCEYNRKEWDKEIFKLKQKYGDNIPDEEYNKAGYKIIQIKFTPICLFNIYGKMDGYERYDLSSFDAYFDGRLSQGKEWNETGICPMPGFYEVVESKLKEEFGFNASKVKHWVLRGHDSCIDILAYSFEWREVDW